jgi:hypothetical protein
LTEDCGNTFRNSGTPSASSSLAAFDAAAAARIAAPGRAGARLGELLVGEGFVTPGEVKRALTEQRKTGRRLGEIIFERGLASVPTLVTVLARQLEVELETETGYGAGLRGAIEQRHRAMRGRQSGSVKKRSESSLQYIGHEGPVEEGET